jgi:hypothetical protein
MKNQGKEAIEASEYIPIDDFAARVYTYATQGP